ncbi:iron uptake porin [Pseudanabaena sp. FACHB-2040]|uniref:iron uptake porin n=1 Tax=Pseudanabaena sp. FACHB-2040 TaxID=2692859 RepID=UPI001685FA91|nr:iron uptake porin [Pseudanabaena sp. FACHB-2040]MBD2258861.1 S-layer homology domain-containing protein [Pseudanabaena sp. FACHB-2040]
MTRFNRHTVFSQVVTVLGIAGLSLAAMPQSWVRASELSEVQLSQTNLETPVFSDLSPDAWAYQAIQSLVQNYGCLAGYPDGTFRGDQPVTRYEFAAGMNACLDAVSGFVQERQAANQAEVDLLIESMQQFQTELNELDSRVGR